MRRRTIRQADGSTRSARGRVRPQHGIHRARERTSSDAAVEYHVVDAANAEAVLSPGSNRFDKAVCTMAIMDMPEIGPLFTLLSRVLTPGGAFVFSVTHPCFHAAAIQRFTEISEEQAGRHVIRSGVKVSSYLAPFARKTEGIIGQPEPQWFFHRPLNRKDATDTAMSQSHEGCSISPSVSENCGVDCGLARWFARGAMRAWSY
jgi:hypothetical protein